MTIKFRNYNNQAGISEDYYKVRQFFIDLGYTEFTYARWDWVITHSSLDKSAVGKIGLWEEDDRIVGVATFDTQLGNAYCLTVQGYSFLKKEMLLYSMENLSKDGEFKVLISDIDVEFQNIAADNGFIATEEKENDAIFYIDRTSTDYDLPDGFQITSMEESYDLYQYMRVLWRGFNHELNGEGAFTFTEEVKEKGKEQMIRANVDLNLKIAVTAPDGNFVSYCGMWFEKAAGFAVIEPVATDPDYRRMGLGKAAVLEGIKRVGEMGARKALVGSSQQFYYSIGMHPYATSTMWRRRD